MRSRHDHGCGPHGYATPGPGKRRFGGRGPAGWLHLAAAPTFATMALVNALAVPPAGILCSAGQGMPSLGGMTLMYALMAVFHAGPWLQLMPP